MSSQGGHYMKENALNSMPSEVLLNIYQTIHFKDLCNLRLVNRRMKHVVDGSGQLGSKFSTKKSSRFIISYKIDQNVYVMKSVKYGSKPSIKTLNFTNEDIINGNNFDFIFRFLSISRLQFEDIPKGFLDDSLIYYLIDQFIICRQFSPINLSFHKCDMRNLSNSALKTFLKYCKNNLKTFSITNVWNAREDTFTDEHIEELQMSKLSSLQITKISMKPGHKYLSLTDKIFYQLISANSFPALKLQLCLVSTMGLTSYLKKWINVYGTNSFSSITCTLNQCPGFSKNELLNEFENLPIQISNNYDNFVSIFIEEHPLNIFCINFGGETFAFTSETFNFIKCK